MKFGNKLCSPLLCSFPARYTVEIRLINADPAPALSYRLKRIKISMEMQSMNNRNLR